MGVLLIEDDDEDAFLVEELLAESSLDVRVVRGRTLREALGELPGDIDCVLLDLGTWPPMADEALRPAAVRRRRGAAKFVQGLRVGQWLGLSIGAC